MPLYQVDAFTDQPFGGNPAAVCLLEAPADEAWMQAVATEMNLSETAFLVPREAHAWQLRWFTPTVEVDLCGHATLASAHILWQTGRLTAGHSATFHTRSGLLAATREDAWIELDFPARPGAEAKAPPGLLEALGLMESAFTGRSVDDWLVLASSEQMVRSLNPDYAALAKIDCRGVIVTALAEPGQRYDVISRFFAPAAGIAEDPVTGSAHCTLAPFWSDRLHRPDLTCHQASKRSGTVRTRLCGDRVLLSGQAITVFEAQLQA
ncbi:MAG: PhzF family phenazine biosynthesis protein [Chloroflexi bacterium]|nr:PhzF family phenazine biosynthesis protein [Chloroflexota bacterium]